MSTVIQLDEYRHQHLEKENKPRTCVECEKLKMDIDQRFAKVYEHIILLQTRIAELENEKSEGSSEPEPQAHIEPAQTTEPDLPQTDLPPLADSSLSPESFLALIRSLNGTEDDVEPKTSEPTVGQLLGVIPKSNGSRKRKSVVKHNVETTVTQEMVQREKMESELMSATPSSSSSSSEPSQKRPSTDRRLQAHPSGTGCSNCNVQNSTVWRRDSMKQIVCNPCGLFERNHGTPRPIELKKDYIQKRVRRSIPIKTEQSVFTGFEGQDFAALMAQFGLRI